MTHLLVTIVWPQLFSKCATHNALKMCQPLSSIMFVQLITGTLPFSLYTCMPKCSWHQIQEYLNTKTVKELIIYMVFFYWWGLDRKYSPNLIFCQNFCSQPFLDNRLMWILFRCSLELFADYFWFAYHNMLRLKLNFYSKWTTAQQRDRMQAITLYVLGGFAYQESLRDSRGAVLSSTLQFPTGDASDEF